MYLHAKIVKMDGKDGMRGEFFVSDWRNDFGLWLMLSGWMTVSFVFFDK